MTAQQRALAKHGKLRQLHKYAEECSEAAAAVLRWLAEPTPEHYAQMIEEMADVEVCTAYPRLIWGDGGIDNAVNAKLTRLERNLNDNFNCGA
jgi:hypothetical protein